MQKMNKKSKNDKENIKRIKERYELVPNIFLTDRKKI